MSLSSPLLPKGFPRAPTSGLSHTLDLFWNSPTSKPHHFRDPVPGAQAQRAGSEPGPVVGPYSSISTCELIHSHKNSRRQVITAITQKRVRTLPLDDTGAHAVLQCLSGIQFNVSPLVLWWVYTCYVCWVLTEKYALGKQMTHLKALKGSIK